MDRSGLLKCIAETGYNVGFGAKKHFATFDIVEKLPGLLGFLSLSVGIFSLVFEQLSAKIPSASLAVVGVAALYIALFDHKKSDFERVGKELTQLYNELRDLYRSVEAGSDVAAGHAILKGIETQYYALGMSNQALFSDWYAHYKFFAQQQHDWIDAQIHFKWRDKFPLSFLFFVAVVVILVAVLSATHFWPLVCPAFTPP